MRPVQRLVLHAGPQPFATAVRHVVNANTRYLVLDLDRTIHFGHNMGELLGWELGALRVFGESTLDQMEHRRAVGRLLFDGELPAQSIRYLAHGLRVWGPAGLYYLAFAKLPAHCRLLRKWTYRRFGPEPVRRVQKALQQALMRQLNRVPDRTLRPLAERVWERHGPDQVITKRDLDCLRRDFPKLRVVLTSASPRIMVQVARDRLGADHAEWSEVEDINSGPAKIERLRRNLPEVLQAEGETVGLSDTGNGEDHCWADHFRTVVDVNSTSPFPPLVDDQSPLEEIHSMELSTERERQRRASGHSAWVDRRRKWRRWETTVLEGSELASQLSDLQDSAGLAPEDPFQRSQVLRAATRRIRNLERPNIHPTRPIARPNLAIEAGSAVQFE